MSNNSGTSSQVFSLPQGGGALQGIGEKFSPDLFTGTGNFTILIALPPGRSGFQPQVNLVYSTGCGNGPFGLGWALNVPGVSRKTSKGVPRYRDAQADLSKRDTFILSGVEDLLPVQDSPLETHYRPRTEGLFARIIHHHNAAAGINYWEVRSKDGLVSTYGHNPADLPDYAAGWDSFGDSALITKPGDPSRIFAWKLTLTQDPFGNRIEYLYRQSKTGPEDQSRGHNAAQPLLEQIRYADFNGADGKTAFIVTVTFDYEDRPDHFSDYRPGFETRMVERCRAIRIETHFGETRKVRQYQLVYNQTAYSKISLLEKILVTGYDDAGNAYDDSDPAFAMLLPPLTFGYAPFDPQSRTFQPVTGMQLPVQSLTNPTLEMADLTGDGLPDILEVNGSARYWRNLGQGRFDLPRTMHTIPAGLSLAHPEVQMIDADGDGRADLLTTINGLTGYFPLRHDGKWDSRSFQPFSQAPGFSLDDPEVKLVDLDGDGLTDIIRSNSRLECYFYRPETGGWGETRWLERQALDEFPNVNFSDPRVKWGDMNGDGLQDILLVYDGNVEYWPNLGHGDWGKRIRMYASPCFSDQGYSFGYDPRRILIGDVDGDGLDDIVYVDNRKVTLWLNQCGNGWSEPIVIDGTPPISDMDTVRLVDLLGSGTRGVLWSADTSSLTRSPMFFLDFTGGMKPYLLSEMDNHLGAVTRIAYQPSTSFFLEDQKNIKTRWKTTLPFPVQVVARVEVIDGLSKGKLTTEYRYHHGYWDGAEREFRGFGMVEQKDTEVFERYHQAGLHGSQADFAAVPQASGGEQRFSPPLLTRTWFHLGPIGPASGDWKADSDWSGDYWKGDPPLLNPREYTDAFLKSLPGNDPRSRRNRRDALRSLRGSMLRTELYALDGSEREARPYTVTESQYALHEIEPPGGGAERPRIFFPHLRARRTTQWERGSEPMTQFTFIRYTAEDDSGAFDPFGRPLAQTQVACPRGWRTMDDQPAEAYLATRTCTRYTEPLDPQVYIHDRTARVTEYEITITQGKRVSELAAFADTAPALECIGQTLNYFDGDAFAGLPLGQLEKYGALTRTERLVLTEKILQDAYGAQIPSYIEPTGSPNWSLNNGYPQEFRDRLPPRAGYIFHPGSTDPADLRGYFANTQRTGYDFQMGVTGRGLVLETLDPLHDSSSDPHGHRTVIAYDPYQFLPVKVTDAAGLSVQASYNLRVLQPGKVTDPNGSTRSFTFTPLGLLEGSFIQGKTPAEGDQNRPSLRLEYDFMAYMNSPAGSPQPAFVRSVRCVYHDTEPDVSQPELDETLSTVEYSDGFGRLLQTRVQGEEVRFGDEHFGGGESVLPVNQRDGPGGDVIGRMNTNALEPNVVVTGWQVYDNKGRVVEKYEPFFSTGWAYGQPNDHQNGQKITMFYDPRGQMIRTRYPDQSEQHVIYGVPGSTAAPDLEHLEVFEPTPWEAYTYDPNDNAGRTHPTESAGYQHHWNTPTSIRVDALGRTVETVERNRDDRPSPLVEVRTLKAYDIRGNVLTLTDALGRQAFQHVYDLTNQILRLESIDAGTHVTILDAASSVIEQRDSKGAWSLHSYDGLNRPTRLWARDKTGEALTLRERLEYGDGGSPTQPDAEREAQRQANRLGMPYRYFDEAGLITFDAYDFKGNLLEKTRQVVNESAILQVFQGPPPAWEVPVFRVNWATPSAVSLDAKKYTTSIRYDALNRVKSATYPEDVENKRRELKPRYNRAGVLEGVTLNGATFVEHIAYNAKGQRVLIAYGSGIMTRYAYDPRAFRLLRLRTEPFTSPAKRTYRRSGEALQDFGYTLDLAGNITGIQDRAPGSGLPAAPNQLDRAFGYDALYRLRFASGRECDTPPPVPPNAPWDDQPRCTDITRVSKYEERYEYDSVGNVLQLQHTHFRADGSPQGSRRSFTLLNESNRIQKVMVANQPFDYLYDSSGNLISETSSRHFEWDYANRLSVYRTQTTGSEPSVHAHYLYDASGQQVMKLVRKQGGRVEITVTIDGVFEYQRTVHAGTVEQNNTLHIMDNHSRLATVRVGAPFAGDTTPAIQYHLGDHLGSSSIVVDATGSLVNREEYTPYGETSFGSFARKRYRFSCKERDEVSGLYDFGERFYAPWLGRWLNPDPAGPVDGPNLYAYVRGNPINRSDPKGLQSVDRDAGAGPTDVSGAEVQQANTTSQQNNTASTTPKAAAGGGTGPVSPAIAGAAIAPVAAASPGAPPIPMQTPGTPGPPVSTPPGTPNIPARAPGFGPNSFQPGSWRMPPATNQAPVVAPGPTPVVLQILAGAGVILTCGLLFHGDAPIPEAPPVPTAADLDKAFVEITKQQNDILSKAIQKHDWSYIAAYTPKRMEAIMRLFPTNPELAYTLFQQAYGKVLELMVRDALELDDRTAGYFEHRGGAKEADFWGRGPIQGFAYDITTYDSAQEHHERPYGENLRVVPYKPPWSP